MILSHRHESSPDAEAAGQRPALHIHLKMPHEELSRKPPSRLAQTLGLDVYSDILLTKHARTEMNFSAILLVVVCLFETLAWSFLFNAIFNSNIFYIGWKTLPAIATALLFSSAVLWFERQFLTYDESRRDRARVAAYIRLGFILVAALITAQPLELFFFKKPVEKRVHQEGIRLEAVTRLEELNKGRFRGDQFHEREIKAEGALLKSVQDQIRLEEDKKKELEAALIFSVGRQGRLKTESEWYRKRGAAIPGSESPEERRARENYLRATAGYSAAAGEAGEIRTQIEASKTTLASLRTEEKGVQEKLKQLEQTRNQAIEEQYNRLELWVEQLQKSKPKEVFSEEWKNTAGQNPKPWPYEDPEYDFFEQLKVVWDLAFGKPPRWLNATPEVRKTLEAEYGFGNLYQGEQGWQIHLLLSILVCHLLALFIPVLVLVIKMVLMPKPLRNYYTSHLQAEAGDPDAWLSQLVEENARIDEAIHLRKIP